MNTIFQIFFYSLWLGLPIFLFRTYLWNLEKRAKQTIRNFSDNSSEIFFNLNVWVKNFDFTKKKNMFELNPYATSYSFNYCDLILNDNNIVIVGKAKIFGKNRTLTPFILEFTNKEMTLEYRHSKITNFVESGIDLEIEFIDPQYSKTMTLVIKRPEAQLKSVIKERYSVLN